MTVSSELRARLPRLHLIADSRQLRRPDFAEMVARFAEAGGPGLALHLRGHDLDAAALFQCASDCREAVADAGSWLIVNDRIDVAMSVGADGVQLGERSMEVSDARRVVGAAVAIGASVHDPMAAQAARSGGADFLLAGTIFASASHPDRTPAGTDLIARSTDAECPVIAIGGIGPGQVAEVRDAGAWGIAVISAVWESPDPVAALNELIQRVER